MPEIIGHECKFEFEFKITAPEVAYKTLRKLEEILLESNEGDAIHGFSAKIRPILDETKWLDLTYDLHRSKKPFDENANVQSGEDV